MLKNEINQDNLPSTAYLQVNCDLLNNKIYKKLDMTTIMLYSLYANRTTCSIYNSGDGSWKDDNNRIYILFTNEEAAKILRVSSRKISDSRSALQEYGLIEVQKFGLKQNRIFVANPEHSEEEGVMSYKGHKINYKVSISPEVEKYSTSKSHNNHTSVLNHKTVNTKDTRVTNSKQNVSKDNDTSSDEALIDALKYRYKNIFDDKFFINLKHATQNNYKQAKWFIDTIFKAKYSSTKAFKNSGLPVDLILATTFEENSYYRDNIAGALLIIIEQAYRYKKVENIGGFIYSFMRGFFIEQTKAFICDNYEIDNALYAVLNSVQNKKDKKLILSK
ncbi:replication initiator protein A [Liquorilactobacillus hordei]|uniref:Replication protein n=1 Tax=Liquorilactobacillus hordei DSM 19519 TaxID=1423759 RepID=A0A0R1MJ20_9LACO|nr:replication initiator protein A [Liquorilactobacillus hordei]KRL07910.1 replication protein [Liquorilactobacillus hordei DSM 19519]QYH50996.1 hypothetical protein G6O70_00075 [Liquorilactobacillus hordei DSM 19519]QYH51143.1 hypothetical protein G6O70_00870 [Liquorilactobacillus hordei DSM 19519]